MYTQQAAAFLYCVSPVHMGAGSATGVIDNPIQRERHTGHPSFAGSGIKGAVRHAWAKLAPDAKDQRDRIFGPEAGSSDLHAGAVSFGDAQLVAFPIRSLRGGYVYATSPLALARAARQLQQVGRDPQWQSLDVADGQCLIAPGSADSITRNGKLDLEVFQYQASENDGLAGIGQWLADNALCEQHAPEYFRNKLRNHLVVLSDTDFAHFVHNATLVETHVRINETTGAADDGGLFYSENLPPESLLIVPIMASRERTGANDGLEADAVMGHIRTAVNNAVIQMGGDATTGRGQVAFNMIAGG